VIHDFKNDLAMIKSTQHSNTEKVQFVLGQLYDTLLFPDRGGRSRYEGGGQGNGSVIQDNNKVNAENLNRLVRHYAESLKLGHKHIFQSLPRLLTLWFENSTNDKVSADQKEKLNQTVKDMSRTVPSYIWLSVFPQLVSRICHPEPRVLDCLKTIIAQVLGKHPKEALWAMVAVIKSSQTSRSKPAKQILETVYKLFPNSREWRDAAKEFLGFEGSAGIVGELSKVCNITVIPAGRNAPAKKSGKGLTMRGDCKVLWDMAPRTSVLVPIQAMLTPTFPASGLSDPSHHPFPDSSVTIKAFGDKIDVMASLMSPVVIRIIGSDGNQYKFLCKPKDDLRKDSRMMDFNTVINRLLAKDGDARRRNLYIRTFSVIPLREDQGMIQWVNDTMVLRTILQDYYSMDKTAAWIKTSRIQELYNRELRPKGKLSTLELYEKIIVDFPPVFHRWFLDHFPEPSSWVAARNNYTRTTAVWSMVGFVIGLGDRHAENILFDSTTGDCVHVDFACLFNKGETLQVPERVPFRLTRNLVDPMGVSGHEGGFTNICAVTMKVLRGNRDSLMNVLETFAHDPLLDWLRKENESNKTLARCERRLRGEVTRFPNTRDIAQVLSVDGQVRAVIAEAVSPANLSEMYRWWMPWF